MLVCRAPLVGVGRSVFRTLLIVGCLFGPLVAASFAAPRPASADIFATVCDVLIIRDGPSRRDTAPCHGVARCAISTSVRGYYSETTAYYFFTTKKWVAIGSAAVACDNYTPVTVTVTVQVTGGPPQPYSGSGNGSADAAGPAYADIGAETTCFSANTLAVFEGFGNAADAAQFCNV